MRELKKILLNEKKTFTLDLFLQTLNLRFDSKIEDLINIMSEKGIPFNILSVKKAGDMRVKNVNLNDLFYIYVEYKLSIFNR